MPDTQWDPLATGPTRAEQGRTLRRVFDGVTTTGSLYRLGFGDVWLGAHGGVKVSKAGDWFVAHNECTCSAGKPGNEHQAHARWCPRG